MDSGKKDSFKALFYLHRYDKYTIVLARTDYLHPLLRKYDEEIKRVEAKAPRTSEVREKDVEVPKDNGKIEKMDLLGKI